MRHGMMINPSTLKCITCNRGLKDHTDLAQCECCPNVGPCDVVEGILMCVSCEDKHLLARKSQVESQQPLVEEMKVSSSLDRLSPEDLLTKARQLEQSVRYSGDYFNLEAISIMEVRKAIYENDLISTDKKELEYHNAIANRIFHYQEVLIKNNQENFELYQRIAKGKEELRSFGHEVTKEIREKLKQTDALYVVEPPKVVKPKVAKKKDADSPYEMMIKSVMAMRNCSRTEAEIILREQTAKMEKES